ncbi:hemagglutinin repeat-containing protein [Rheinheimera sp.]|uniref:hemagglutinin repeat-containing protein n=1 Tax=Rheinheimera sp. TaxID=1869214 RepID=UPI002356BB5A|nr:hemagglutinin repeat-containing protein [Rheinheimera sp.]
MLNINWRNTIARALILVMAGNPVILAAHGMERALNSQLQLQLSEQRELALLKQQAAAQAALQPAAGVSLASAQQAGVKTAENGVSVIDIAAPSERGVSHNRLTSFNVPAAGLILNNSKDPMISILGGWTDGNRRLTAGAASLILAEVTGSSRSNLLGYTEVLGQSAEFVLANPNGITCSGCGFINTPRVVLATGVPELSNGELTGIRVSGGDVVIDGLGFNASNISKVDILTRAMQLNAALYANELNIRTGANVYQYQSGQIQSSNALATSAPGYQFALDASALGAMYANTISLIGTEAGLGVRSEGLLHATDSLQLTADGKLQLKDTIAGSALTLRSQSSDISTSGITYGSSVDIELPGTLTNTGLIGTAGQMQINAATLQQSGDMIAGINIQGEWLDDAVQQLNIAGSVVNQGRLISQGQQLLSAAQLHNTDSAVMQAVSAELTAEQISNEGVITANTLMLSADRADNSGHLQASDLMLNTAQFTMLGGTLYQQGGQGKLQFSAQNLHLNAGILVTEGLAQFNVSGQLSNQADWLSAGHSTLSSGQFSNSGNIQFTGQADISAGQLTNSGNILFSRPQAVSINAQDSLNNSGSLQFASDANLSAAIISNDNGRLYHLGSGALTLQAGQRLTNNNGQLFSNGQLQLTAPQLENRQGNITAAATIGESLRLNISNILDNTAGTIVAEGQRLSLNTEQIINNRGTVILAGMDGFNITAAAQLQNDNGLLHSESDLTLTTPQLSNVQGLIQTAGNLAQLKAQQLDNTKGSIVVAGDAGRLNIDAASVQNVQGNIQANGQFVLSANNFNNQSGYVAALQQADITAAVLDNQAGQILADNLVIKSVELSNIAGGIQGGSQLDLSSTLLRNLEGVIASDRLNLSSEQLDNEAGQLLAGTALSLHAQQLNNSGGIIAADGKVTVDASTVINADAAVIAAAEVELDATSLTNINQARIEGQQVTLNTDTLDNSGILLATGSQGETLRLNTRLLNNQGRIESHGDQFTLQNLQLNNQQGQIYHLGSGVLQLDYLGELNNEQGQIYAESALRINGANLNNRSGSVAAKQVLQLTVADADNHKGTIQAGAGLILSADKLNNQQGVIAADGNMRLSAQQLDNSSGQLLQLGAGTLNIDSVKTLTNSQGLIYTSGRLVLQADELDNSTGELQAGAILFRGDRLNNRDGKILAMGQQADSLVLQADDLLDNSAGTIYSAGGSARISATNIINDAGSVSQAGNGHLLLSANHLSNGNGGVIAGTGVLQLDVLEQLNNGGLIDAGLLYVSAGNLHNSGTMQAEYARLSSRQLHNDGLILALGTSGESLQLQASDGIVNRGHIQSHGESLIINDVLDNTGGTLVHAGADTLQLARLTNNQGSVFAQNNLLVSGDLSNVDGDIQALGTLGVIAARLDNQQGVIRSGGNMLMDVVTLDNRGGEISSHGEQTSLTAAEAIHNAGGSIVSAGAQLDVQADQLDVANGIIAGRGQVQLSAAQLNVISDGQIRSEQVLQINAGSVQNQGLISAAEVLMQADSLTNQDGVVEAATQLQLDAGYVDNTEGMLLSQGQLRLQLLGTQNDVALQNSGGQVVASGELVLITPYAIDNTNGQLLSEQQLQLTAGALDNTAGQVLAGNGLALDVAANIDNSGGLLYSASGNMTLAANSLLNDAAGKVLQHGSGQMQLTLGTLDNRGEIGAATVLAVTAEQLNNSGMLQSEMTQLTTQQLQNTGYLLGNELAIDSQLLDNTNGTIAALGADGSSRISAAELINQQGVIQSQGARLQLDGALNNQQGEVIMLGAGELAITGLAGNAQGQILSQGTMTLAGQVNNDLGLLQAADALHASATDISNNGGVIFAGNRLTLGADSLTNHGGTISAANDYQLNISGTLDNSQQGVLTAAGEMSVAAGSLLNNTGLIYQQGTGSLLLQAGSQLNNDNGQILAQRHANISAAQLSNDNGRIETTALLELQSTGTLNNNGGTITSAVISAQAAALTNRGGTVFAADTVNINATTLDNSDGTLASNATVELTASDLRNANGLLQANNLLNISAQRTENNSGTIQSANIALNSQQSLNNSSGVINAQTLAIQTGALNNSYGVLLATSGADNALQLNSGVSLNNHNGTVASYGRNQNLSLASLSNSAGQLLHLGSGNFTLSQAGTLTNAGSIASANSLTLNASAVNNSGTLQAQQQLNVQASLNNQSGAALLANNITVSAGAGSIVNSGTVSAANSLQLGAGSIQNNQLLYAGNSAALNAASVTNNGNVSANNLSVSGFSLLQNSGRIESATASYSGTTLQNAGGELVNASSAANSLQLNVAELNNSGTVYNSASDMRFGGNLTNSGNIVHAGNGTLLLGSNGAVNNNGGSIASAGRVTVSNNISGSGTVYAEQGMLINSAGTFVNQSQLYTKGDMQVTAALDNQGSLLADANLSINTSGAVSNSGTLQGQNLNLTAGAVTNNGGTITSTGSGNALINAASLNNSNGLIQASNNNLTISTAAAGLNNSNGQIKHAGNGVLSLGSSGQFVQQSGITQTLGQLQLAAQGGIDNSYGVLAASQFQLTSAGGLNNSAGQIIGSGSAVSSISVQALNNNNGQIAANGGGLTLTGSTLNNSNGSILLAGTGVLAITADSVANDTSGSRIISNGSISLNAGALLNNAGEISAASQLTASAATVTNSGILASRGGRAEVSSTGNVSNSGTISGAQAAVVTAQALNNTGGTLQSDGAVELTVQNLTAGKIYAQDLTLNSASNIVLQSGEQLSASRNLQLQTSGNIINGGSIVASGTLGLGAGELTNSASGIIRSGGNAVLDLNRLNNSGIISSNSTLRLDAGNTTNTGTLAAGSQLDINGNISNSNLLYAGNLLTIDGSVSNTANIYSNGNASIAGSSITNSGGTIAAAQNLSISGSILNDHTGTVRFVDGAVTNTQNYVGNDPLRDYDQRGPRQTVTVTLEKRKTTTYSAELAGSSGVIAAGGNMSLSGSITNNFSTISAGNNLTLSGSNFSNNSGSNQLVHEVQVYEQTVVVGCLVSFTDTGACYEPGPGYEGEQVLVREYTETTFEGGSVGTVYAGGGISGSLSGDVELSSASPLNGGLVSGVGTSASGSSGSATRGSNASASSGAAVAVTTGSGTAASTAGENRVASGVSAGGPGSVSVGWQNNNASQGDITADVVTAPLTDVTAQQLDSIDDSALTVANGQSLQGQQQQANQTGTATLRSQQANNNNPLSSGNNGVPQLAIAGVTADKQQVDAGKLLQDGADGSARPGETLDNGLGNTHQPDALTANITAEGLGFLAPDVAGNFQQLQPGRAPQIPQGSAQAGNTVVVSTGDHNPDLIIKGLVDDQQGKLAQQQANQAQQSSLNNAGSQPVNGQQAGKNVFLTDAQMRVLTEDLGFDADAINQGQQVLYATISQNDLLADGVTLSAGGVIDITADAGFSLDAGISAGEGLILRSDAGLNMGNLGFFDSENLLGLQLGGDFTNTMNLQSDTLWFDIGGDFTNLGSLTGSDVLSISAGNDLINQNLLSGGHVLLNAGGDIINRTEFSQHTVKNGDNSTTYTTVGKAPQIISTDSLSMTAGNNIDLQGSKFSADGDISLNAGNDVLLGAVEKLSGHEKYFKGGYDIELNRTYDVVSFDAGGNLSVVAGNNLQSEGAVFAAAGDVELAAGNEMNLLGVVEYHEDRDKRTKKSTFKKTVYVDETYSAEHQGSVILAGGNVSLNAQQTADGLQLFNSGDVLLEGTIIQAGGNMVAYSGGELNIVSGEEWQSENHTKKKSMFGGLFGSTKTTETDVQYLGHAELNAAGDITLLAQQDINVLAGRINAGNIVAQAGFGNEAEKAADINILGDTETTSLYQENRRNGLALGFSDNFLSVAKETANENRTIQTDYVGSVFTATDNMALSASRDINVVGSELHAGNNLLLDAGRDINVATGQGSGSSYSHHSETKTGIAISADSNTASVFAGDDTQKDALTQDSISQTGSVLTAGNNVQLTAGNNLLVSGSDIIAGLDLRLKAVNDISIVSAKEQFNQQTEHSSIRDGLTVNANYNIGNTVDAISNLGQGGDATSIASSVMQAADTLNNAGPSAGAHLGQTTTTTTDTVQQGIAKGSSLTAGRDVLVSAGGDALFEGATVDAGRDLTVNAENISVIAAQNNSGSKHNTEYLQVGLNLSASTSNVSLTAGFSQADSELNTQNTDAVGSSLQAGNNVNLNASNDLHIIGSDINADNDVALVAGNDIVIKAAESQFSSNSEDSHLSVGAGINFGSDGIGVTANMAMGEGELDREGTNHSNSHITAGNNLSVTSGNDTTIAGGNLAATDVDMDIGGDLTVASVQDTSQVEGDRWDVSANITVGAGVSGGASVGYGETEGSSAWVNEQSSIIGSGSVNIRTEGHTQIDGAVIANIDENGNDAGNLTLDTGSLAYTDIADHDKEKSYYLNVGFTTGDDTSTNQTEGGTNYNASGNYSNHDKEQINRATVGEGNIVVRDNAEQDLSDLNRDTSLAQEVTKDDSKDVNLYASTTALDSLGNLVESPEKRDEQLNKWKDNVASIGSTDAWGNVANNVKGAGYTAMLVASDAVTVEEFNNNVARQKTLRESILTLADTEASPEERKDAVEGYIFNALPWNEDSPDAIAARDAIANEIEHLMLTDPAKAEQALAMLANGQTDPLQTNLGPLAFTIPELLIFLGIGTTAVANSDEGQQAASEIAKGIGGLFGKDAAPAWSESEVFGKTLTEPFDVFDMLEVGQAYQMSDGRIVVKSNSTYMTISDAGSDLGGLQMVSAEQLGQQGGYTTPDIGLLTNTGTPAADPSDIPGNVGGYQAGEEISSNTGTPVREGHWSDSLFFNKDNVDLTNGRDGHILANHGSGAGKPDKTEFPADWKKEQIIHTVSDIATDPTLPMQTDNRGTPFVTGIRDGIEIRVNFYPVGHSREGQISTAYPLNTPANPGRK